MTTNDDHGADDGRPTPRLRDRRPRAGRPTSRDRPSPWVRANGARSRLGRGWRPPAPSEATRTWDPKSQGAQRVAAASGEDRLTVTESGGEFKALSVARAHPLVASVREQPEAVPYVEDGVERRHTPDFLAVLRDGRRVGVVVKPDARAAEARRLVGTLREQRSGDLDAWIHVGDALTPRSLVKRADLIAWVRRDGPFPGDPVVERVRALVDRPMTVAEAVVASGAGGWGYRAVVRLIADGVLRMRDGWTIAHEKTVEPARLGPTPADRQTEMENRQ